MGVIQITGGRILVNSKPGDDQALQDALTAGLDLESIFKIKCIYKVTSEVKPGIFVLTQVFLEKVSYPFSLKLSFEDSTRNNLCGISINGGPSLELKGVNLIVLIQSFLSIGGVEINRIIQGGDKTQINYAFLHNQ